MFFFLSRGESYLRPAKISFFRGTATGLRLALIISNAFYTILKFYKWCDTVWGPRRPCHAEKKEGWVGGWHSDCSRQSGTRLADGRLAWNLLHSNRHARPTWNAADFGDDRNVRRRINEIIPCADRATCYLRAGQRTSPEREGWLNRKLWQNQNSRNRTRQSPIRRHAGRRYLASSTAWSTPKSQATSRMVGAMPTAWRSSRALSRKTRHFPMAT